MEDSVGVALLARAGREAFPAFRLQSLAATRSTQDLVRAAARAGAAAGYCCMAASQTAGRGRQDRAWTAPPGSALLVSVLVRVRAARATGVPIAAGLALRAAIEATSGCDCLLKWPNDLLVGHGKVAGILCEVEPAAPGPETAVAVGVGVNLWVRSFPAGVRGVSLHQLVAAPPSPPRLLAALLGQLAERLALLGDGTLGPLRAEWMDHAAGLGELVMATSATGVATGVAEGIDEDGALILRGPSGALRVLAGDVHLVGRDTVG
jgi:BirA family transcriptional regulator, biotin operon repressor / biotin---[acetyl-CoA-carboxylase] ligase